MMKNYVLKVVFLFVVLFMAYGCDEESVTENTNPEQFYEPANEKVVNAINNWFTTSSGRIGSGFTIGDVYTIVNEEAGMELHTVLNAANTAESVAFSVVEGEVVNPFITNTTVTNEGEIKSEIFTIEGELMLTFIDKQTESGIIRQLIPSNTNGRLSGWWSDFDDCFGRFHDPSDCQICNDAFTTIANAATIGLYTSLSLPVCALVAYGKNR